MKAAKLFAPGDIRIVEMEKPSPGPGEVLVQVKEVGVCASDVHYFRDGRIGDTVVTEPLILGHEFAGVIAEVGPGVTNVKVGDRVAVEPAIPCNECYLCAEGAFNLCRNIKFCGTPPYDGALREFLAWPAGLVVPVPDSVSFGEAAMLEPLAIGVYAVDLAEPIRGKSIGVLGVGAVGLSILEAAKAAGCGMAIATDLIPGRLEIAKKLGADKTFLADDKVVQAVKATTHDQGLDIVFEAAGENEAVMQATEMVRPNGLVVVGGIPREDSMTVTASTVRRKGLTIKLLRRSNQTLHRSVELLKNGKANLAPFISHTFPLDQVTEAFELARDRKDLTLRVMITL
ncbi:MAG TPA: NAD(P)-dependent alcohol dehydrogenase [Armatimonadota bacterium]|nr:NAD(P)-dependent alcohol dehydrogenase [Armatimonadota bacterium]